MSGHPAAAIILKLSAPLSPAKSVVGDPGILPSNFPRVCPQRVAVVVRAVLSGVDQPKPKDLERGYFRWSSTRNGGLERRAWDSNPRWMSPPIAVFKTGNREAVTWANVALAGLIAVDLPQVDFPEGGTRRRILGP